MDYHLIKSDKTHIPNATYMYHGQSCINQPFNSGDEDFQRDSTINGLDVDQGRLNELFSPRFEI